MRTTLVVSVFVAALALTMVNSEFNSTALLACTEGHNFAKQDYERIAINGASAREEKCFVSCILNVIGLMEDGKPTAKNAEVVANEAARRNEPEKSKGIKEAIEKCSEEVKPTEPCDTAEELRACLYKNGKQYLEM